MAGLVRQECLGCTHHLRPVCDGTGVRLVREPGGRVVDVQLCVRWPASWDEPIAFHEARDRYGLLDTSIVPVPDRVWPAVQADIVRSRRLPADGTPAEGQEPAEVERETLGAMRAVVLAVLAFLTVLVLVAVLVVRS